VGKTEKFRRDCCINSFFQRPSELIVVIDFDIVKQGILVDQILTSKGLYIQAGRDGDRFKTKPDAKKIIIEIPDTGFLKLGINCFIAIL